MSDSDERDDGVESVGADASTATDGLVAERLPPEDAFDMLSHGTRFRILETLNEAGEPLGFADLRERVGVADPGQFNYHLGKLVGRFVSDGDDGYELTAAGGRVVGAVLSGGYTKALDAEPIRTGVPCVTCESEMELRFEGEKIEVECPACEETYTNNPIPAGIFEDVTAAEAPAVLDRWLKRLHSTADYGFCPNCDGQLERRVLVPDGENGPDAIDVDEEATVRYECGRCGFSWYSSFPFAVLLHPAVVGMFHDHGVDVRTTPFWDLDGLDVDAATVESRDPIRVDVRVDLDEETVVFTFDDDLDVVEQRST